MHRPAVWLLFLTMIACTGKPDGAAMHYTAGGIGPVTIVLIHGWTCDHTFWDGQIPALKQRYRVLAVDLPGHGRSGRAPDYTMKRFARAVHEALEKEKVQKAVLAGHSMGGAVMLEFARLHPEKVLAIIGVDAFFPAPGTTGPLEARAALFEGPGGMEERARMIRGMFTAATPPEVRAKIESVMLAAPAEVAAGAMRGLADPAVWREDIIDAPFLQIAAAASTHITEEGLRRRFPRAELVRVPDTGHFLHMERPDEVNRILLEWLSRQGL